MKRILIVMFLIGICTPFYQGYAQKCKPDGQFKDKFTKKENTYWIEEIYKPGFADGVLSSLENSTSSINISLLIGRFGDENYLQLILKKQEASMESAKFESALKAEKGNEFLLGFKEAEAMTFVSTSVQNSTKMDNINNVLVTIVSLDCKISDEDLIKLEPLAKNQITAVRAKLMNSMIVEQEVRNKQGENTMEDFVCAIKFFKEKGFMK